jgi:hypothetical protein
MKANEAPEKIYITPNFDRRYFSKKIDVDSVEYTRTDAFIEKAYKFFAPYIQDNSGGYDRAYMYERFKNYMKGGKNEP